MKHVLESRTTLTNVGAGDAQPNAVDLRLEKVFLIHPNLFMIDNEFKQHRGTTEILPDHNGWFHLEPGHYEVVMENIIKVGNDEAGWVITRSTLNRNGLFLTSGLYDTGYHGVMAAVLHVTIGDASIKKGTRIGQYLCFDAEALHHYEGSYGIGTDHDKKYAKE